MSAHILLLAMGGLLVIVAILGGGIEAREIRIPEIGKWPRVMAGLAGIFFLTLGIKFDPENHLLSPKPAPAVSPSGTPASEMVTFKIRDELGEGQVEEQVRIVINGKEAGYLTVNATYPASTITVTVPRSGTYHYLLEADAVFRDGGKDYKFSGGGQGNIEVREGILFDLIAPAVITGDGWQAHMEEAEQP